MSYDISLKIKTGDNYVDVVDCGNYTYNCSKMFQEANELKLSLSDLNNGCSGEVIPVLEEVISNMRKDKEKYEAMNPPNGWGDYECFLKFLENILGEFKKNDLCRLSVS